MGEKRQNNPDKMKIRRRLLHFLERKKFCNVAPFNNSNGSIFVEDAESCCLVDMSWTAWRQGQKFDPNKPEKGTASKFLRRPAISEEMEKHIWFKGFNLREIREYLCKMEHLKTYGVA